MYSPWHNESINYTESTFPTMPMCAGCTDNISQILLVLVQTWLPSAFTTNKGLRFVCVLLRIEHLHTNITNRSWILAREKWSDITLSMWLGMQYGLVVQWLKLLPRADSSPIHTGAVLRNKQRRRNGEPSIRAGNLERLCGKGQCSCHAGWQAILSRGNALKSCRFVNARRPAAVWMGSARGSRMKGNQLCGHFLVQCGEWEAGGPCVRRHMSVGC